MDTATLLLVMTILLIGSILQRFAGMGFALFSAPFLILVIGVSEGIFILNVTAAVVSLLMTLQVFKDIEFFAFLKMSVAGVLGISVTFFLVKDLPPSALAIFSGIILLALAVLSAYLSRFSVQLSSPSLIYLAGFFSGVSNITAGAGGPILAAYSILSNWSTKKFIATIQPFFVVTAITAACYRYTNAERLGIEVPDLVTWFLLLACLAAGLLIGRVIVRQISDNRARMVLIIVAIIGSLTVIIEGVLSLLSIEML